MLEILRIIFIILLLFALLLFIVNRKYITYWPEKEKSSNYRTIGLISWVMCLSVCVFFILLLLPNDIFIFRYMGSIFYLIGIFVLGALYLANKDMKDSEWMEEKWAALVWGSIFVFLIIYGLINP